MMDTIQSVSSFLKNDKHTIGLMTSKQLAEFVAGALDDIAAKENERYSATIRGQVLAEAARCVLGDREDDYGTPEDSFATIADFWTVYLMSGCVSPDADLCIRPADVAAMMALLKIARILTGVSKRDNWVDLAGYAACGAEAEHV